MKKSIDTFCFFTLLFCGMLFPHASYATQHKKRILILHAYHQGFHWTDRIMQGMTGVLSEHDHIELFINYMDTKRKSDNDYFEHLKTLYQTKYQHFQFDAIITSDDHALDFMLNFRDELFPNTPVIFSGLNDFPSGRLGGQKGFTGVFESYDVGGTVDLMLKLHPETKKIVAITDETRSGNIFKSLLKEIEPNLPETVEVAYWHNVAPDLIVNSLKQLPDDALVLWAIYLRMPSGVTLSSKESVKLISSNSHVPTYCVWDVVGQGVVGGKITSPVYQGKTAARIALRVLNGVPIESIPVKGSPLVNIFDYHAMQRFDISLEQLPQDRIVLNKPESIYERFKAYIWIYLTIIILLLIIIVFLIAIILLKRNRDELEGMAMHDQLTGLYNRHYLQEVASQKLAEAARHQHSLCLLVLDIDHFKKINDTHGHPVGDIVLKSLANLLNEQNRSEDIVARIGGEEFVILLDHCNSGKAVEKAEALRLRVTQLNPNNIPITISIGVTQLKSQGESFDNLLKRADDALYEAKQSGRNRIVFH